MSRGLRRSPCLSIATRLLYHGVPLQCLVVDVQFRDVCHANCWSVCDKHGVIVQTTPNANTIILPCRHGHITWDVHASSMRHAAAMRPCPSHRAGSLPISVLVVILIRNDTTSSTCAIDRGPLHILDRFRHGWCLFYASSQANEPDCVCIL